MTQAPATIRELLGPLTPRARAREAARGAALHVRAFRAQRRRGVRVVHYHYVLAAQRNAFARQLEWLTRVFTVVPLSEAVRRLNAAEIEGDELAVTFDDGFRVQRTTAAPLLEAAGVHACFFLISRFIGADADARDRICRERLHLSQPLEPLDWADAHALAAAGHELGSHTRTHPDLLSLDPDELRDEIAGSRADLERRMGSIVHFSAPYGDTARFDAGISDAARAAGYGSCSTAQRGINTSSGDVFALRRHHLVADWPTPYLKAFLGRP